MAHTVQSIDWGAELGWTTLTANRRSVKAVLRDLKAARVAGGWEVMTITLLQFGSVWPKVSLKDSGISKVIYRGTAL